MPDGEIIHRERNFGQIRLFGDDDCLLQAHLAAVDQIIIVVYRNDQFVGDVFDGGKIKSKLYAHGGDLQIFRFDDGQLFDDRFVLAAYARILNGKGNIGGTGLYIIDRDIDDGALYEGTVFIDVAAQGGIGDDALVGRSDLHIFVLIPRADIDIFAERNVKFVFIVPLVFVHGDGVGNEPGEEHEVARQLFGIRSRLRGEGDVCRGHGEGIAVLFFFAGGAVESDARYVLVGVFALRRYGDHLAGLGRRLARGQGVVCRRFRSDRIRYGDAGLITRFLSAAAGGEEHCAQCCRAEHGHCGKQTFFHIPEKTSLWIFLRLL